jgi:hypothetical protein
VGAVGKGVKQRGVLVDGNAARRRALGEREVLEAMARRPRREFHEAIRLQGDTLATG